MRFDHNIYRCVDIERNTSKKSRDSSADAENIQKLSRRSKQAGRRRLEGGAKDGGSSTTITTQQQLQRQRRQNRARRKRKLLLNYTSYVPFPSPSPPPSSSSAFRKNIDRKWTFIPEVGADRNDGDIARARTCCFCYFIDRTRLCMAAPSLSLDAGACAANDSDTTTRRARRCCSDL
ncbi:unnamed protein product [Trichogramma brassicae]|uniref:Uncharacterized protein n=1 Tax=Trichogramma brassicae TaxID=86971 RepID=A0A6H5IKX4_9HYME|nr:unnamed protein product [Trichogramma brassicae]